LVAEKAGSRPLSSPVKCPQRRRRLPGYQRLDKVQILVGPETVRKIPKRGWEPEDLHKMTDGTRFEGVDTLRLGLGQTGCTILDSSYEDCEWVEGWENRSSNGPKETSKILTEQWPKTQEIRKKIDKMAIWLEQDQANHFFETR